MELPRVNRPSRQRLQPDKAVIEIAADEIGEQQPEAALAGLLQTA